MAVGGDDARLSVHSYAFSGVPAAFDAANRGGLLARSLGEKCGSTRVILVECFAVVQLILSVVVTSSYGRVLGLRLINLSWSMSSCCFRS